MVAGIPASLKAASSSEVTFSMNTSRSGARSVELGLDLGVDPRFEDRKASILQLVLDLLHTEAVGERDVDIEGLPGHPLLFLQPEGGDRANVVEAVRQLHQEHPDVLGHRDHHLADRGGLGLLR